SSFLAVFVRFFFQAEAGIRGRNVTGVQTCALPIYEQPLTLKRIDHPGDGSCTHPQIGGELSHAGWLGLAHRDEQPGTRLGQPDRFTEQAVGLHAEDPRCIEEQSYHFPGWNLLDVLTLCDRCTHTHGITESLHYLPPHNEVARDY